MRKPHDLPAAKNPPGAVRAALRCAFPYTLPIFAGFCFLGMCTCAAPVSRCGTR